MITQRWSALGRSRLHAALVGSLVLAVALASACATNAKTAPLTPAPPTPAPPAALATLAPATPRPAAANAAASGPQINIGNFNFTPADLMITAGMTVTWTNHDDVPHTVTSAEKKFASPTVESDGQFSFTFTAPGTYAYFCSIHPFMTAKVFVK